MDKNKGEFRMALDLKDITKDLFYYLGIPKTLLWFSRSCGYPKWFIFTYHRVSPSSYNNNACLNVSCDAFDRQMKFIKDNFETVSMLEGLKVLKGNFSKGIYATINLDDGYMDNYLYAYPILRKYSIPATIFLTTDFIGKDHLFWWDRVFNIVSSNNGTKQSAHITNSINARLRDKDENERDELIKGLQGYSSSKDVPSYAMLGWSEIRRMNANLISFGAHTKTHRNLCLLEDDEIRKELTGSKKEIEEKLGIEVTEFAYPFGIFDDKVKILVDEAGFRCARSTLQGFNSRETDRFLLTRIAADSLSKASSLAVRTSIKSLKAYTKGILA